MTQNAIVILLDVDGPLNPFAAKPTKRPEGHLTHRYEWKQGKYQKPLRVWLNPLHGPLLDALGAEIVWATMWEHEANSWIAPKIGLGEKSVIEWKDWDYSNPERLHPKTRRIAEWMNSNRPGQPFIWVDDEPTGRDAAYLDENCNSEAKILRIDPKFGLMEADFLYLEFLINKMKGNNG